jgi:hypothetical protein
MGRLNRSEERNESRRAYEHTDVSPYHHRGPREFAERECGKSSRLFPAKHDADQAARTLVTFTGCFVTVS